MANLKMKDQRPEYVIDRQAMADRIREAIENAPDEAGTNEIAQFCGVARSLVYEWQRTASISPENLEKLCSCTNVDFEWIMFGVTDEDSFQTRTEDTNVVELERPLKDNRIPDVDSLVTRYIGIYELDEVQDLIKNDPDDFHKIVHKFTKRPTDRTSIAIALNPNRIDTVGIPKFAFQFLITGTAIPRGAYLGYANDVVPARGSFAMFAIKRTGQEDFSFANGFYYTVNDRQISSNMRQGFKAKNSRGFVLKLDPDRDHAADVYLMPDDFDDWSRDCRLIGTATYMTQWLDHTQLNYHTGLTERLERIHEGRAFQFDT